MQPKRCRWGVVCSRGLPFDFRSHGEGRRCLPICEIVRVRAAPRGRLAAVIFVPSSSHLSRTVQVVVRRKQRGGRARHVNAGRLDAIDATLAISFLPLLSISNFT